MEGFCADFNHSQQTEDFDTFYAKEIFDLFNKIQVYYSSYGDSLKKIDLIYFFLDNPNMFKLMNIYPLPLI